MWAHVLRCYALTVTMQELTANGDSDELTGHDKEKSLNVSRCLIALFLSACIQCFCFGSYESFSI